MGTWQNGRNGSPLVIKVPLGTVVRELARDDPRRSKDEYEAEEEGLDGLSLAERRQKIRDSRWLHYPGYDDANMERDTFKEAEQGLFAQERERRRARRLRSLNPVTLDLDKIEETVVPDDAPLGTGNREPLGHLIASGGQGGVGNPHFLSQLNRSPKFATRGYGGERRTFSLELKILADIGLVGFPNAGKSTLLRALTGGRAKTEVASYAFTTLNPVVGVVRVADDGTFEGAVQGQLVYEETLVEEQLLEDTRAAEEFIANDRSGENYEEDFHPDNLPESTLVSDSSEDPRPGHHFDIVETFRFTIADNPGLISRASENVGLGHSFLRSMERSLALVYVVDLAGPAPWDELRVLRSELEKYKPGMSTKARMVIANKADLFGGEDDSAAIEEAKRKLQKLEEFVRTEFVLGTSDSDGNAVPTSLLKSTLDVVPVSAKFCQNMRKVVGLMRSYVEDARRTGAENAATP
jgi:GTPase